MTNFFHVHVTILGDEYAYRIPNPYSTLVHQGKGTQDKHEYPR